MHIRAQDIFTVINAILTWKLQSESIWDRLWAHFCPKCTTLWKFSCLWRNGNENFQLWLGERGRDGVNFWQLLRFKIRTLNDSCRYGAEAMSWDTPLLGIIDNFTPSSLSLASQNYLLKQFLSSSWRFYSHPFNILLYLTVKWPPLIACLCLAAAAVAAVLWTNIRGNYVEIKIYMKHCGCWGKFSYFWCCFINDLGDICKSAQSFWFRGCVHKAVFCFSFGVWGLWKERTGIRKIW